ncbi:MerR family transcriptional regulator [Alkalimarinus coralli]|uniref:MerR family transcriptional regulator n=1 Tax=Alkalimarinus coralli TaxID=2935863 RepID=UPI00202B78A1|nr:MerR family transcriptional regulator [Alkalimarinus coralli]
MSQQDSQVETARFPIRELSARTKVNTVTIRAWERRYGLLTPQRTSKGHRLYSDSDVTTVEKILALVARGVPLGKVKALLTEDEPDDGYNALDTWAEPVEALLGAVQAFSSSRIEHLVDEYFLNYPPAVCRERLVEPALETLAQDGNSNAALVFAESELIRYATLRLNNKGASNKRPVLVMACGDNTPVWRLSLMAMEFADAGYKVQLITQPLSVDACVEITAKLTDAKVIFYQDGLWRENEAEKMSQTLSSCDGLILIGTAPILAGLEDDQKVFNDLGQCIRVINKAP